MADTVDKGDIGDLFLLCVADTGPVEDVGGNGLQVTPLAAWNMSPS